MSRAYSFDANRQHSRLQKYLLSVSNIKVIITQYVLYNTFITC